jgi:replication-associated recombination protein RarA
MLNKELFWEKYRPTTVDELIVPERIKRIALSGINGNYIFHGNSGCGKSSLAKILLNDYQGSCLQLSSKLGVDELRTTVSRFCKSMIPFEDPDKLRVVYFEEFDRASHQLQEELKSFIEDHSKRVRFIATCNNISKINTAVRSRFIEVDFTPIGDEAKDLKNKFGKRVFDICKTENIKISKEIIKNIFDKRFPDFRKVWQDIQQYHLTGNVDNSGKTDDDIKLFNIVLDKRDTVLIWEYLYINWMDKIDIAFQKLGREFFDWIKTEHPDRVDKLGSCVIVVSDYTDLKLPNALDPFLTLGALVFRMNEIMEK